MNTLRLRMFIFGLCLGPTLSLFAQDPRTPISSLPYKITAEGSYYLTANLTATGAGAGITIAADNVTLDLDGFALVGGGSGSVTGINVPATHKNILIRNGTVRGWTYGGINASNANNSVIQDIRLSNNAAPSIFYNIAALTIGNGSIVKGCFVANNTNASGISIGTASTVTGCVARANPQGAGIRSSDNCYVFGNISDSNGTGITMGSGNRIESNSCTSNAGAGILVPSGATNNLVIRNSSRANNPNYNIAPGNRYGSIVNLTSGLTGAANGDYAASTIATTDPWANFAY